MLSKVMVGASRTTNTHHLCVCAHAQNVLRKVQRDDATQISNMVMSSLLGMLKSTAGSGGVQEDALMAVSTLVEGGQHTHRYSHTHMHARRVIL